MALEVTCVMWTIFLHSPQSLLPPPVPQGEVSTVRSLQNVLSLQSLGTRDQTDVNKVMYLGNDKPSPQRQELRERRERSSGKGIFCLMKSFVTFIIHKQILMDFYSLTSNLEFLPQFLECQNYRCVLSCQTEVFCSQSIIYWLVA